MDVIRAAESHRANIVGLEDVQYLQCSDSLAARRQLVDVPAAVIRRHGRNPFRTMIRKIFITQQPALFRHEGVDLLCDFSFVKRLSAACGDRRVGIRKPRIAESFAFAGHSPLRHIRFCKVRVLGVIRLTSRQVIRDDLGYRESFSRILDGRSEDLAHRQAPVALV